MADKKKMSVADMLAAARKADGGAAAGGDKPATPPAEEAASPPAAAEAASPNPAAKKPATGAGGARPSVAEMMAMARANKGDAPAAPEAKKPAEKPAPKAPAAKPAAAAAKPAPAPPAPDRETGSVLTASPKKDKPGPMSKAEAAASPAPPRAPAVPKIIVPPMPVKPDYAKAKGAKPAAATAGEAIDGARRNFMAIGMWALGAVSTLWTLLTVKFMFPNVLREPPSKFKVGFPDAFPGGQVSEKFKAQYGIWLVNTEYNGKPEIFALKSVCTHLGCTPNWLEAEQKFKCPCHGSGFYKDGINFEGPAPRPLERYAIRLADDGQIEVDKSRTFQEEMGAWSDPACYVDV
jgi:cytochrome b6-f complex iron-sulfur subunit